MATDSDCKCDSGGSTSCRDVIVRTYRDLRRCGQDDVSAFRSAARVLALRHPERSSDANLAIAARWLSNDVDK